MDSLISGGSNVNVNIDYLVQQVTSILALLACFFLARPMVVKGDEDELCRERGVTAQVLDCHLKKQICMESCSWFGIMGVSQGGMKSST